ncbi:MAG: hypothetical protein ACAI37_19935 [Chthoniobacter sp.]
MRLRSSSTCALVLLALTAHPGPAAAQVIIQRRGAVVNQGEIIFLSDGQTAAKVEADPAGPHLIEFFDGRLLHGTLESLDLTRQEMTWKRSDASAPLTISTAQISRLTFVPTAVAVNDNSPGISGLEPNGPQRSAKDDKIHGTVKFVGGDWLAAEVTNIQDNKVHLKLGDGSPLAVDRAQVDWIYFSKSFASECYDGPTSLSGWSGNGWTYRDGALRATTPAQLTRNFAALPDQVEYDLTIDQGNLMTAFNLTLHGRVGNSWGNDLSMIQCMMRASTLTLYSNSEGRFKNEQVDLTKVFGATLDGRNKPDKTNPVRFRVFEDFTGGRLAIFINDRKAGEWNVQKGESGRNRGGLIFQPTIWNSNGEQSLSKVRVVPWDGRIPADGEKAADETKDRISLADGTTSEGKFIDLASGTARLRSESNTLEAQQEKVKMLRFARREGAPEALPDTIARVRLVQGGEFDVAGLRWLDGKLQIKARFGAEFPIPVTAVTELRFLQTPPVLATAEDTLVFQNGDRLKGKLDVAEENQKVRWRTDEAAKPVEFEMARVAGVRGGWSDNGQKGKLDCVARFRNGDWLAGRFLTLDKNTLVIETADAGQLSINRALVRTLYFSRDGTLPVSDAASDDREWLRGMDLNNIQASSNTTNRKPPVNMASLWKSFDGAYALLPMDTGEASISRVGGIHIGRQLASLPALVEMSFDVTGLRNQILFSAQLFTEGGNPGYFLQMHNQGLYIYDLNPSVRGRGGIVPQQIQFEGKIKLDTRQRHVQLLANRDTGQVLVLVDGVVITKFGGKPGAPPRQLARGIMISPQVNLPCMFSNIWLGPWNGQVPGKTPQSDASQDTAILSNGDEAPGAVDVATPSTVKLTSDVGLLDLPLDRVTMIDFGGAPVERTLGARLHLAGSGCLTVGAYHVENATVTCRSEMVGELHLPLHAVQELVFTPPKMTPADPNAAKE